MSTAGDALGTAIYNALLALSAEDKINGLKCWKAIANQLEVVHVPIGGIIAWHKNLTGTPDLPGNFVECNGQTLDDEDSPYHEQVIPNLNGDPDHADSPGLTRKEQMFLRGGLTSGVGQDDATDVNNLGISPNPHNHGISPNPHSHTFDFGTADGGGYVDQASNKTATKGSTPTSLSVGNRSLSLTSTDSETRPANMSVVWIIRVK